VDRHITRLVTRLVVLLVVDNSASRRLVVDYFAPPRIQVPRHVVAPSRGSSRCSSSTTPPRTGSSSTTSPPLRVRVPRHVVRLVTRLVAPLVVD
jgi:hypothetical protein